MKIGFWNFYEGLNHNNYIFLNPNAPIGDNLLKPVNELYSYAKRKGIELNTLDVIKDFEELDAFVFFDFPDMKHALVRKAFESKSPKYLVIWESEVIKPDNWDPDNHRYFRKICTWKDSLIDNKKYFKINYAHEFPPSINKNLSHKARLCALMASRKRAKHPLEIYSRRLEAIRWFEKHHPEEFDLYGFGWDGYKLVRRSWAKNVDKIPIIRKIIPARFPSYRGRVEAKRPILEKYRFSICYENARDISGYITEKIFDSFFAGCVPVYWGADNVSDHIPGSCFIDRRKFGGYAELYGFMKTMSEGTYLTYLENIESFLKSEKAYQFSSEYFSKTVIDILLS